MTAPTLTTLLSSARDAERRGDWTVALDLFRSAFARLPAEGGAAEAVEILRRTARIHIEIRELDSAEELAEASLAVAEANRLTLAEAAALIMLGSVLQHRGNVPAAEAAYDRAAALADDAGNAEYRAIAIQNLGILANIRGDVEVALERYGGALALFERQGNTSLAMRTLNNIAMAHVDLQEWEAAEAAFGRAALLAGEVGERDMLRRVALNRAELYIGRGWYERARECCDTAFELAVELGSAAGRAEAFRMYGILYRESGEHQQADLFLAEAVRLARAQRTPLLEAEALGEWAQLHLLHQRNADALRCLNQAHQLFSELQAVRDLAGVDRRRSGLEAMYQRVVHDWSASIEAKDAYTAGHAERVADHACALAAAGGMTAQELVWFRMGAYLHDVGKLAIPVELLNRSGLLTLDERSLLESHTCLGAAMVADLNFPWDIQPLLRSHHERWDGCGYPDRLAGEQIPLGARILCIADAYCTLTSGRRHREALSSTEALRVMGAEAGSAFDPELFDRFRELVEAGAIRAGGGGRRSWSSAVA